MSEGKKRAGGAGQRHALNVAVELGDDGYWGTEQVPILEWESPEHRVVLPATLQAVLGLPSPVLRWAREKVQQVQVRHAHPTEVIQRRAISERLDAWEYAGPQPGKGNTWHVFFVEDGRWTLAVIGRDQTSSYNFVTMYRPTKGNLLANKVGSGKYVSRQERI